MALIESMVGIIPAGLVLFCTILSFIIPYSVYRINRALLDYGAPPWKREDS